jgi:hypothetical protein
MADGQGDLAVCLEVDQIEDRHKAIAELEIFEPRRQLAWTAAPEVVEPVIAVRRSAQLTEPSKDDRRRRFDVDAAEVDLLRVIEIGLASEGQLAFALGAAPGPGQVI